MRRVLIGSLVTALIAILCGAVPLAHAGKKRSLASSGDAVALYAGEERVKDGDSSGPGDPPGGTTSARGQGANRMSAASLRAWRQEMAARELMGAMEDRFCAVVDLLCRSEIDAIGTAIALPTGGSGVPPETIAYSALARLKLNPPEPTVGPPPSINEWKMAAVGYPLWFWVEGNLDPAPVSDTVYDLTVSLDARLEKVVFDLGDGNTMTCTDVSRKWTRAVEPGTPSPVCGYRYTKPSLPKGKYTITANAVWAVDWSVNGTTGTIPVYQSATTTLPVGELQVLTR